MTRRSLSTSVTVPERTFGKKAVMLLTAGLLAAAVLAFGSTSASAARQLCGPRGDIVEKLKSGYKEQQSAIGITGSGMLTELFVSASGSWTIVFTRPDGVSCLMAAGQGWEDLVPAVADEEEEIHS